jgi:hypothetical protein
VGFRITDEALVFGGRTLTLSDVGAAAGRIELGDTDRVAHLERDLIERVDAHLRARFSRILESFERTGERPAVVLVGGGAVLVEHVLKELGREVIRPDHGGVANAYGAAIAQVGGEVDLTFSLDTISRAEAIRRSKLAAHQRAAEAGARPESIRTIELEDAAIGYLSADALRVRARAVGDL